MQLKERQGSLRQRDDFDAEPLTVTQGETGRVFDFATSENKEWFLEAKVAVTFWANKAQYQQARAIAERALMARLYEGFHVELRNMRLAISDGDKRKAFAVVDRMQKLIEG